MNPRQIGLIMTSWDKVFPIADKAAELFYGKLFELDPEVKKLFKTDQVEQGEKLMTMIDAVVKSLDNIDVVLPIIQASGRRHVDYGVKDDDYNTVGEALIWTLGTGLGDEFTEEVKEAWLAAYTLLATTMIEAAHSVAA